MSDIPRQLLARIESIDETVADTGRRTEAYQRMAEDLKEVTGRASSPDGVVTVVAGAGGAISSVTFTDRISTISPGALSADVLRAMVEARSSAARAQAEVVRRGLGDTELLDRVLDSDERLFGDARPDEPTPAAAIPARRQPRPADEEQEDFENFGVFDDRTKW